MGDQRQQKQSSGRFVQRHGNAQAHSNKARRHLIVDSTGDIAEYASVFKRTGFRGGLNGYRNLARSWELMAPWRSAVIRQPSLFIAGARDDVLRFPHSRANIARFAQTLPGLRGSHILDGAGHWIQRERAAAVNDLLLGFLRGL